MCATVLGIAAASVTVPARAAPATPVSSDILPQPLARALDLLTSQTGLQIIYVSSLIGRQTSGRATAGMSAQEALGHLLQGTGLTFTELAAGSVRIVAAAAAPRGEHVPTGDRDRAADHDEVLITARHRSEPAWAVPLAMTVFTGVELARDGIEDLNSLSLAAPGLTYTYARGNGGVPVIRGMASTYASPTENNVATVYDGLYVSNAFSVDMNMLDLQHLDVLRGPQNALLGRNAFAGAILYEPARPTAQFEAGSEGEAGSDGFARASAFVSGPLRDGFTGRLSAARETYDGTIRNRADPGNNLGGWGRSAVSGALQWESGAALSARLSGFWFEVQRDATPRFAVGNAQIPFNCGRSAGGGYDDYCGAFPALNVLDLSPDARGLRSQTTLGRFELTWRFGWSELASLTGFIDSHSDERPDDWDLSSAGELIPVAKASAPDTVVRLQPANVYFSGYPVDDREWSEELRLSGSRAGLQWLVGIYGADSRSLTHLGLSTDARGLAPDEVFPGGYNGTRTPLVLLPAGASWQQSDFLSAFASFNQAITDGLDLGTQLRWTEERIDYLDGEPTVTRAITTPRLTVSYLVAPEAQLYTSAARGARFALYNGQPQPDSGTDTNWTYELGFKSGAADRRAQASADVFLVNWSDMQLAGTNAARVTGFELAVDADPTDWLSLHVGYAYTDARYRAGTFNGADVGGNHLPYAPVDAAALQAAIHGDLPRELHWRLQTGVDLVSSEYVGSGNLNWLAAREVWNVRMSLAGNRWEAALWGRNLGLRPYSGYASFEAVDQFYVVDRLNAGMWGVTLAYRFN